MKYIKLLVLLRATNLVCLTVFARQTNLRRVGGGVVAKQSYLSTSLNKSAKRVQLYGLLAGLMKWNSIKQTKLVHENKPMKILKSVN